MLALHDHNKKVLTVLLFWIGLAFILISTGFLLYRATTDVPNTEMSTAGEAGRFVVAAMLSVAALLFSRAAYKSLGTRASLSDMLSGRVLEPGYVEPAYMSAEDDADYLAPVELDAAGNPVVDIDARGRRSPLIRRVMDVVKDDAVVALDGKSLEYHEDTDRDPSTFALVALKPGGLTAEKTVTRYNELILKGIPEGRVLWSMEEDPVHDRVWFKKKTPFPPIVLPDVPETVVSDTDDAVARYDDFRFVIGVDAFGEDILINPKAMPHGMVIGGSGSGKSVFNRGLLEYLRVNGWQIVLVDGKISDYVSMVNAPNVVAVGKKVEDWVRLTQFVVEQMDARYALATERQRKGLGDPFDQPPMVFLLDEFGTVVRYVRSRYGNKGLAAFYNDLKSIAAKARQAKIHMIIATQEIYAETFPGDLKSNLSYIISLGVPETNTLLNSFSNEARPAATRIGQSIRKTDQGRGIIQIDTPNGAKVVEFQSYYGYSPGDPDGIPEKDGEVRRAWLEYKENASDKIPLLYPRMWWDEPTPDELKELENVDDLTQFKMTGIQNRDGTIKPDKVHLDRNGDEYIGDQISADGAVQLLGFGEE